METYSGVFIASTNLMDNLDPAALRRFDLKVGFGFLKPDQAEMLLDSYSRNLSLASTPATDRQRLRAMHKLTPGDFAAVARQHRFRPVTSASAFVNALAAECALKSPVSRKIGFLA
jgi:ATP-dependent 26S proteasome regulatory subunit